MYTPANFEEKNIDVMIDFIKAYPFAAIVTHGENGLSAEHLPIFIDADSQGKLVLQAHIATANPLWKVIKDGEPVLVIFQGPNSYITPNWFPSKAKDHKVVPTWNYTAVHAKGTISFIHESEWKMLLLDKLTSAHEQKQATPWAMSDAPEDFIKKLMPAIVGIEVGVDDLQAKFKLSQNQSSENRSGVVRGLKSINHEMAYLMGEP